jgi:hypothetical protein
MGLFWNRDRPSQAVFPQIDPKKTRHELLEELHAYVKTFAIEQRDWYMRNRVSRGRISSGIRFFSLLFLFLGGLCPLVPRGIHIAYLPVSDFLSLGYFLLGIGGGLLLFDRLFDFSAAWMRYVLAAFEINSRLDEFRMSWVRIILLGAKDGLSDDTLSRPHWRS